jgi:hypothetical protein
MKKMIAGHTAEKMEEGRAVVEAKMMAWTR